MNPIPEGRVNNPVGDKVYILRRIFDFNGDCDSTLLAILKQAE